MKKALKWVGIALAAVVVMVVVVGFLSPSKWAVERSIVIDAEPEAVHAWIGDYEKWPEWSPFEDQDPDMVMKIEGQASGVGARRSWVSPEMGDGAMWITESDPATGVSMKLEMEGMEPLDIRFTFEAVDGGTKVTWRDWGDFGNNPIYRLIGTQMESMMGPTFERGLAQLKEKVESAAAADPEKTPEKTPEDG